MPPTTIAERQLLAVLTRIADELDMIDSTLMNLIEAIADSSHGIQASINDWAPE